MLKDWWLRLVLLGLLGIILGVPFVARPPQEVITRAGVDPTLVIISPHNEQIRFEFSRAFNEHRQQRGQPRVHFDWRSSGGTSDLRKMILADFQARAEDGREDDGIGADLFFGGGDYEHGKIARGITVTTDDQTRHVDIVVPLQIDDAAFEHTFPEPVIGGEPLYDRNRAWVGVVLSSFGIVYNRDVLQMLDLPEPKTWSDLTDPRYRSQIALADPAHSGSLAATYNTILRREGWTEGWWLLRRVFANARYFTSSANKVPVDVSAGEAAAGMCIDFYGRYQAGAIGGDRVGYVDPLYATAITADPITILRGAPNLELAQEFVRWLLLPETQLLWQTRRGEEFGPVKFELRRLPIRRDLYQQAGMANWTDQVKPFEITKPFPRAMPNYYATVAPIAHAMAIDIHLELQAAWEVLATHSDHPRYDEMVRLFDAMPPTLTLNWPQPELATQWREIIEQPEHPRYAEVAHVLKDFMGTLDKRWKDPDQMLRDRLDFTLFFRENYRQLIALAQQP